MVSFPYPKYMNAIMDVDMAAAVIVTDAATAQQWGLRQTRSPISRLGRRR